MKNRKNNAETRLRVALAGILVEVGNIKVGVESPELTNRAKKALQRDLDRLQAAAHRMIATLDDEEVRTSGH